MQNRTLCGGKSSQQDRACCTQFPEYHSSHTSGCRSVKCPAQNSPAAIDSDGASRGGWQPAENVFSRSVASRPVAAHNIHGTGHAAAATRSDSLSPMFPVSSVPDIRVPVCNLSDSYSACCPVQQESLKGRIHAGQDQQFRLGRQAAGERLFPAGGGIGSRTDCRISRFSGA